MKKNKTLREYFETYSVARALLKKTRWFAVVILFFSGTAYLLAQANPAPATSSSSSATESNAEFFATADEVLGVMSKMLNLPVRAPLKKSIRTKEQIRAYLISEQKKDETTRKQYADQRTLEAFGLIPKGFPLNSFMLDLLTDQVAGLYDPQKKEFYIADWISPDEQRPVMAHELTHALDDQYFHLEKWQKAVQANDDASMARDAVVEGSAFDAMFDYTYAPLHIGVRELPDIAPAIEAGMASEMMKDPNLAKAPAIIRDELLFPYLEGGIFTQQFLKANSGWGDFKKVFENPPVSTQQILHPKLYLDNVKPKIVALPGLDSAIPHGWKKLDDNVVGEFGLCEIFKQFLGEDKAKQYSAMWDGDRYALFENPKTKQTILVVLFALDNAGDTPKFYTAYRDLLAKKYDVTKFIQEADEFAESDKTFLDCRQDECLAVEGPDSNTTRGVGMNIMRTLNWPSLPLPPDTVIVPIVHASRPAPGHSSP